MGYDFLVLTIMLAHAFIWSGAILAGLCGTALLAWALFSDRSRGRRRCGRCWYPMDHAASLRCPECGHEAKSDRAHYRTRRRWKWAAASLLPLLLATFLAVQPKVQRDGWGSIVPATVMILLLRVDDRQWVIEGIEYHISEWHSMGIDIGFHAPADEQLWRWQWRILTRSILMRLEEETLVFDRTKYHTWLSASADAVGDVALRERCIDAIIRDLSHADASVRHSAAIYSIDDEDIDGSIKRAVGLLDHEDTRTRISGVRSLLSIANRTRQGIPALIDALQHEHAEVRSDALWAIGVMAKDRGPVPEAFDAVYALEHDEDGNVRLRRIITLADLQPEDEAWKTIGTALRHDDPYVRRGGLNAAYMVHRPPSHVSLRMIECLGDPDATVRQSAASIVPRIDAFYLMDHSALLQSFLNHDDSDVRSAAERTLHRIHQMGHR